MYNYMKAISIGRLYLLALSALLIFTTCTTTQKVTNSKSLVLQCDTASVSLSADDHLFIRWEHNGTNHGTYSYTKDPETKEKNLAVPVGVQLHKVEPDSLTLVSSEWDSRDNLEYLPGRIFAVRPLDFALKIPIDEITEITVFPPDYEPNGIDIRRGEYEGILFLDMLMGFAGGGIVAWAITLGRDDEEHDPLIEQITTRQVLYFGLAGTVIYPLYKYLTRDKFIDNPDVKSILKEARTYDLAGEECSLRLRERQR